MPDLLTTKAAIKKVLGIVGDAVGLSDTQTIDNKTFPSTTGLKIRNAEDTASTAFLAGASSNNTVTIPSGSFTMVGHSINQTLTNKILTTPELTTPTINGSKHADAAKTTAYTLLTTDSIIRADASAGAFTLTLPAASGNEGLTYTIIRTDILSSTNFLTIDGNASETIDGNLTYLLLPGESIIIECDGSNWQVLKGNEPSHPGYFYRKGSTANRRYIAGMLLNSTLVTSTTGPTVNTLYATPLIVTKTTKFDLIEMEVTTLGTGSNCRLGVYRDDGNLYPGALIFDSGNISTATTGAKSATITSSLQIFQPGLYWLTYENSATVPQVRALPGLSTTIPVLGWLTPFGVATGGLGYSVAHTVGALPNPYTAGGTILTTSTATAPVPAVGLRAV
jgi:hypothetical protein